MIETKESMKVLVETISNIFALKAELKGARDEAKSLLEGEQAYYYKQLSLFSLNRDLHSPFASLNIVDYVKQKYNKNPILISLC